MLKQPSLKSILRSKTELAGHFHSETNPSAKKIQFCSELDHGDGLAPGKPRSAAKKADKTQEMKG